MGERKEEEKSFPGETSSYPILFGRFLQRTAGKARGQDQATMELHAVSTPRDLRVAEKVWYDGKSESKKIVQPKLNSPWREATKRITE